MQDAARHSWSSDVEREQFLESFMSQAVRLGMDPGAVQRIRNELDGRNKDGQLWEELYQHERAARLAAEARAASLAESEAHCRAIAEAASFGVWLCESEGKCTYLSSCLLELTGLTMEQAQGFGWTRALPPEDVEAVLQAWMQCVRSGEAWERELRLRDRHGNLHTALGRARPVYDQAGRITQWVGIIVDITARKWTEDALRLAETRFRIAAESVSDVIYEWDIENGWHLWYGDIDGLLGFPPGGCPRTLQAWTSRLHPEDRQRVLTALAHSLETGAFFSEEYRIARKDGQYRYWRDRGRVLHDAQHRPTRWIGSVADITEIKQGNEMREQLAAVVEATPDMVASATVEGRLLYMNRAGRRLLGIPEQANLAEWTIERTHSHWAHRIVRDEGIPTAIREGSWSGETAVLNHAGREIPVSQVIVAHRAADSSVEHLSTIARDISQRKQAEEALRASEERYRFLTEAIPQMVWSCDASGRLLDFNNRWFEYTGQTPEEASGDGWARALHPDDRQSTFERWMHSLVTGEKYEFEGRLRRAADGSYRWHLAQATPMRDEQGRIVRWFGTCTDIDELKRASMDRLRLAALVEYSRDFIGLAQLDGTALFLNAGGRELVGLAHDAPPPAVAEYLFPEDRPIIAQTVVPAVLQDGRWTGEFRFRHFVTGEPIDMLWDVFRIDDPRTGKPLCLATVSRDIRHRKRIEQERERLLDEAHMAKEQAEAANQAKDQFLAVLSHELRTPLTPVLAKLAMMRSESNLAGSLREDLDVIQRNVQLEAQLINDLLDTTRIARGKLELHPEVADAHEKVRAAVDIFQREISAKSLRLVMDLRAERHHVKADPVRLQQVFWNLISNAVKYTPRQGSITIRSSNEPDGTLKVQVIDTGIGIEPELMPRLFTAFEQGEQTLTRRFGGLGLGLSISRSLLEMQGGRLTAASQGKDKGATFTVELNTVSRPAEERPSYQPPAQQPRYHSVRVLLVEDNEDTLRVMARLLQAYGHQVKTAASMHEALEAAKERFDLVISDIGLPDGTGWDLMRTLHERQPVRGIALSGFASDEDAQRSKGAGFVAHLAKPINPEELETAIQRVAAEG